MKDFKTEREVIAVSNGWTLVETKYIYKGDSSSSYAIGQENTKRSNESQFRREIFNHTDYLKDSHELDIRISTTSYGSMNIDEIEEMIEEYKKAIETVEVFSKIIKEKENENE